ncbi:MAG: 4a-hydroxytetrahydrobiopterin dehydratase [Prochloraceae cyanobacterium]
MTLELKEQKCEPCTGKSPRLSPEEIERLKQEIPEWKTIEVEGELRLQNVYKFPDFVTALDFTNRIAAEAEREGHHPSLLTEWGKVTVTWWTHAISGLHQNDFIMAAKTDAINKNISK